MNLSSLDNPSKRVNPGAGGGLSSEAVQQEAAFVAKFDDLIQKRKKKFWQLTINPRAEIFLKGKTLYLGWGEFY